MHRSSKNSLARETMQSMAIRITVVMICATGASYYHMGEILKNQHLTQLEKYVKERGAREATLFTLAENNHATMKPRFLEALKMGYQGSVETDFDALFVRRADGSWRDRDSEGIDTKSEPTFYHGPQVQMTRDLKEKLLVGRKTLKNYALAYENQFADTYFTTPENSMFLFWPGLNWGAGAPSDLDMRKEEYISVADAKNNPERRTVWTGMYFDVAVDVWMLSVETPVYDGDRLLITLGHDILLNEILDRAANLSLPGTRNIIIREDGRLIAHPSYMEQIKKSGGKLLATDDTNNNGDLKRIFAAIPTKAGGSTITYDPVGENYYGSYFITGPNWNFLVEYPKSLITSQAYEATKFIFWLGIISLVGELIVVFFVIRKRVAVPLRELVLDAQRVSGGDFTVRSKIKRDDEIGMLSNTFNSMLETIVDRDTRLRDHARELENKIEERTRSLEEQRAQMVASSKMASLGEMAGGLAHEINNPLGVIHGYSDLLVDLSGDGEVKSDDVTNAANKIKTATERISKIIQGLRTFSRDGSRDPFERATIESIVEDTLSLCKQRIYQRNIELNVSNLATETVVFCRTVEVCQVLLNLLNNAIDAVDTSEVKRIEIKISQKNDYLDIAVTDSGIGIPKEIQEKIMQPFFTTKPVGKGTGLGLSISRNLIEGHGGRIELESRPGRTTFSMILPFNQHLPKAA